MRPFNLAEAKIAERHYCKQHVNKRLRVIVLLMVLIAVVAAGSQAGKMVIRSKANHAKSELADWQKKCGNRKQGMTELQTRSSQRKWFRQLGSKSELWLDVLDATLKCVPSDVWLSSIKSSPADFTVDVEGHAASFEAMSAFVSRLRGSSEFSDVHLTGSRTGDTTNIKTLDFSLKLTLKDADKLMAAAGAGTAQTGSVPAAQGTN